MRTRWDGGKALSVIVLAVALTAGVAAAQMDHGGHGDTDAQMQHGEMDGQMMDMPDAAGWRDPEMTISDPPPLTGEQMGQVQTLNVPPLGYEMDGDVKVFTLIAQPIEHQLTTGEPFDDSIIDELNRFTGRRHAHWFEKKVRIWGYNGNSPGPTIECTEGDTIRIILQNELPEPTSIHWHGIELPREMDGSGGTTEPPTPPGETRVYEFTLYQSGTYLYHSGFNMMKQDGNGLVGFLVVHPREIEKPIDRDFAIMLQEWAFHPGNPYADLVTMDFNWFTMGGKAAPDIEVLEVEQGDRVRIRFGNLSMNSHPIHIHGYTWWQVGTEGGPIPESAQWPGNTVNVPPGSTRDVEFVAWNPGVWRLHCHKLHHIINAHADVPMGIMGHGGMFTLVHVKAEDPDAPWQHPGEAGEEMR
ncbi:MAG: multicopper oxidase domain-containing protein [Armatimonadota bacterium]